MSTPKKALFFDPTAARVNSLANVNRSTVQDPGFTGKSSPIIKHRAIKTNKGGKLRRKTKKYHKKSKKRVRKCKKCRGTQKRR